MIKFIDLAIVGGQIFTKGMIAEFDAKTEADLIKEADAVAYVIEASGTIENAVNATNAVNAVNAVNAQNAVTAQTAGHATTAGTATVATTATTANSATTATTATTATNAQNAQNADHASTADTASTATHATTSTSATSATNALMSDKSAGLLIGSTLLEPSIGKPFETLSSFASPVNCTTTGADEALESFLIAAGTLGPNSIIQIEPLWTYTNSANNKILKVNIDGITVYSATRTTSAKEAPLIILANRNSLTSQIQPYDNTYVTAGSGTPPTYAIDFSKNVTVDIIGQRASGSDTLTLEYHRALHFVGD